MDKREFVALAAAVTDDLVAALERTLLFAGGWFRYGWDWIKYPFQIGKYVIENFPLLARLAYYRFYFRKLRRRERYLVARLESHGVLLDEGASNE